MFLSEEEEQQPIETTPIEEAPESTSQKMFETFSRIVETPPQIIEEIVPTEDPGPRFVEKVAPPNPAPVVAPAQASPVVATPVTPVVAAAAAPVIMTEA